ncbi:hypothetical protein BUALT_Bualt02G0184700 [Buddleja alternifolia]|uniref:Uncharacterized protein n=1 Tax=Buddleja alternifolia TaxID=168488 RepID=A0AAV6Y3D7_9LAMI|nr:hypothetical protein BUALT_Bualt02G0184700 [Buddleja alternifolia]
MGIQVSQKNIRPPIASYSPSMWGDIFTSFTLDDQVQEDYGKAIQALKGDARGMLIAEGNTVKDKLILIDTVERLGVGYHFEQEIEDQLQQIFKFQSQDSDLFTTALQFRLLRQHRYHVSSNNFHNFTRKTSNLINPDNIVETGAFDKFKGIDDKFKENLGSDAKGLLSLYEAAHLRIHGEDILEEALAFTVHHLNRMVQQIESPLKDQVKRALQQSLHRGVPRIETRNFISFYEKDDSKNEQLLKLAKLDFNYLQNLYKKELSELSRWWNEFDLKTKLPYARDRVVECYFWGLASRYEPQYSYVRTAVAKNMQMVSTIDDTYDNYATLEEAQLFTEALERWNVDEVERLPDYMKIVYKFILSMYEDYEREAAKRGKSFVTPYAIESVKRLGRAYNKELKWFMERKLPTFDEYFANTYFTGCIEVMYIPVILGMEFVSQQTIDWLMSKPEIVVAASNVGRYLEDLCTHQREEKGGEMLTAVDCYIQQHGGSKSQVLNKFVELVEDAWKDVNTAWITKTCIIPKDMVEQLLNYARVAEVTYKNREDGYTNSEKVLGPQLIALFVDPIII